MCTVVIARRPGRPWPVLFAANRDEDPARPWRPPGRHWPDRANVVAGIDELAGGTWFGLNDEGVVAAVMNRVGTLGPLAGKRSRGELVLEALDHADAGAAALALCDLNPDAYRPFNLVVADNRAAFWLAHRGDGAAILATPITEGCAMLTAHDMNDQASPRIARYLPRFAEAVPTDPGHEPDWVEWEGLLASRERGDPGDPRSAMNLGDEPGFGTVSSSVLALPSVEQTGTLPIWRFAAGAPGEAPFKPIKLE